MNSAPSSGLAVITNGASNTFVFEGDHTITTSFSISQNGVPLFSVSPTNLCLKVIDHTITASFSISQNGTPLFSVSPSGISVGVSLKSISVQQLHYLVNITSDV